MRLGALHIRTKTAKPHDTGFRTKPATVSEPFSAVAIEIVQIRE